MLATNFKRVHLLCQSHHSCFLDLLFMLKTIATVAIVGAVITSLANLFGQLNFAVIVTILLSVSLRWHLKQMSALQAVQRQDPTTWQVIFQNSFDPMLAIDRFGSILASNKALTKTFGYEASELLGQNVTMLMPPGHIRSHHNEYLATYARTRIAHIMGIGREVQAMRKDGTLLDMELAVTEAALDGNSVYIGSLRDLSQRRKDERNAAIARARSEFVAATSHEARSAVVCPSLRLMLTSLWQMRAPLIAVVSVTRLLADTPLSDEQLELVQTVRSGGDSLLRFVNDFLDLSRLEATRLRFERAEFDLHEVCSGLGSM
jgi:PAS domain S-box-containing protein